MYSQQAQSSARPLTAQPSENPVVAKVPADTAGEETVMIGGVAQSVVPLGRRSAELGGGESNPATGRSPANDIAEEAVMVSGVAQSLAVTYGAARQFGDAESNPATGRSPANDIAKEAVMVGGVAQSLAVTRGASRPLGEDDSNPATGRYPPGDIAEEAVMTGGVAVAQSRAASAVHASGWALSDPPPSGLITTLEQSRGHADPANFPINLPQSGSGIDEFAIAIPEGAVHAYLDLETTEASPLASVAVIEPPVRGSTGELRVRVKWSHPPLGRIAYRLRAYASVDGAAPAVRVGESAPNANDRAKLLMDQGVEVLLVVRGERARRLYHAVRDKQASAESSGLVNRAVVTPFEPITIIAGLAIAVVLAAVVMLGFMVLYAIITGAMNKGYDVKDTKYKAGVGSGESRQDHEMIFNLIKPPGG